MRLHKGHPIKNTFPFFLGQQNAEAMTCFDLEEHSTFKKLAAQSSELEDHELGRSNFPSVATKRVRNQLYQTNVPKSRGPDGIHPRVLKESVDVIAGPRSAI